MEWKVIGGFLSFNMLLTVLVVAMFWDCSCAQQRTVVVVNIGDVANLTYLGNTSLNTFRCKRNNAAITNDGKYNMGQNSTNGLLYLMISNVALSDSGDYTCGSSADWIQETTFTLVVVATIAGSVKPNSLMQLNDSIVIECSATFSITANFILGPSQNLILNLIIGNETKNQDGYFTINEVDANRTRHMIWNGTVTHEMKRKNATCSLDSVNLNYHRNVSFKLDIAYPPAKVKFLNETPSMTFNEYDNLICACDSNPASAVLWNIISIPGNCQPVVTNTPGSAQLNLGSGCSGQQSWNCTCIYVNPAIATPSISFMVINFTANTGMAPVNPPPESQDKRLAIGLGVGLGLGLPLLIALCALIAVCCCGRKSQKPDDTKKVPPANTKKSQPVAVNRDPNPMVKPPAYNLEMKSNGNNVVRGSPGIPDIGVAHLDGSGSIPQLNASFDGQQAHVKGRQATGFVNLGRADLGQHNQSYSNI